MKRTIALVLCTALFMLAMPLKGFAAQNPAPKEADAAPFAGETLAEGDWRFCVNSEGLAVVTGYADASALKLTVPDKLGGCPVAAVGARAFCANTALQAIEIPANVLTIASDAFEDIARNVTISALNGSRALAFARHTGIKWKNLSKLCFTHEVIDFSDIRKDSYAYVDSATLSMDALEARRLYEGALIYMPPDEKYDLGEAFEVISVTRTADGALISVKKADPAKIITRITLKETGMTPDIGGITILSEGVTIDKRADSAESKTTLNSSLERAVPIRFNFLRNGVSVSGGVTWTGKLDMELDMDIYPFNINTLKHTLTESTIVDIKVGGDFVDTIELARVPFASAYGVLTAYVILKLEIGVDGVMGVSYEVESVTKGIYRDKQWSATNACSREKFEATSQIKARALLCGAVTVAAPVIGDVVEFGAKIGAEATVKASAATLDLRCVDLKIEMVVLLYGKAGLIRGSDINGEKIDGFKLYIGGDLISRRYEFSHEHWENGVRVAECTKDVATVDFYTQSDTSFPAQSVPIGGRASDPGTPFRNNYGFTGWYADADCTVLWDFSSFTVQGDTTLYAGWSPLPAQAGKVGLTWSFNEDRHTATLSKCESGTVSAVVPSVINGYPLVGINAYAFTFCENLKSVWLPDHISEMPQFSNLINLETIHIPAAVKYLYGFERCVRLKRMVVPGTVSQIGNNTFLECSGLESVVISDGVNVIGSSAFSLCPRLKSVSIPQSVTEIGSNAFNGDSSLNHIAVPCESVGDYAFAGCASLTDVSFTGAIKNLSAGIFSGCGNLVRFDIPASVTEIGSDAFNGCVKLVDIEIPYGVKTVNSNTFRRCASLTSVNMPDSVTKIDDRAFAGCASLTDAAIPDGTTEIGEGAFSGCVSLKSVTLPKNLISIGPRAFAGCPLTSVIIPEGVTEIGEEAFADSALTEITLPKSLSSIGPRAFAGCPLTSVIIPEGVTRLGNEAFNDCRKLTSIYVPKSVLDIGGNVFPTQGNLKTVYCVKGSAVDDASLLPWGCRFVYIDGSARRVIWQSAVGGESGFANPNETLCPPSLPPREGYSFAGWYRDADFANSWDFSSDVMPDADLTLYAKWEAVAEYGFELSSDGCVTAYSGVQTDVIIPPSIRGTVVTGIDSEAFGRDVATVVIPSGVTDIRPGAFSNASRLTSITVDRNNAAYMSVEGVIYSKDATTLVCCPRMKTDGEFIAPQGVRNIAERAFEGGRARKVTLPASVLSIGKRAFSGCDKLISVTLPNGASTIGQGAFSGVGDGFTLYGATGECAVAKYALDNGVGYNLYPLTFYNGNDPILPTRAVAGEALPDPFSGGGYTCEGWKTAKGAQWDLNARVMPAEALDLYAVNLSRTKFILTFDTQCGISGEVRSLSAGTKFSPPTCPRDNYTLVSWNTRDGAAWNFDTGVMPSADMTLYAMWQVIDENLADAPFSYVEENGEITITGFMGGASEQEIPAAVAGKPVTKIGERAFYAEQSLDILTIPESVVEIGAYAFAECAISKIAMRNGVSSLGEYAFADCRSLTSIVLSNHITDLPKGAFAGCAALVEFEIPTGVKTLGEDALADCVYLEKLTLPDTLKTLGARALSGCQRLVALNLAKVASIGANAFLGCKSLTCVSVAADNTNYASLDGVLTDKAETTVVYYPEGRVQTSYTLDKIAGAEAFRASRIENLTIGTDAELSEGAFRDCLHLKTLMFSSGRGPSEIPDGAFDNCMSLKSADLPDGVNRVGAKAFNNCLSLDEIHIPASVSSIGDSALPGIESLVVYATPGTAAHDYAVSQGLRFVTDGNLPVAGITLDCEQKIVAANETFRLSAALIPENVYETKIIWTSDKPSVASVDAGGLVGGLLYGEAVITATAANGASAKCRVTVESARVPATGVTLAHSALRLPKGRAVAVSARVEPLEATNRTVVWTSGDESVAVINELGILTVLGDGVATLTATAADGGGASASCAVTACELGDMTDDGLMNNRDVVTLLNWLRSAKQFDFSQKLCADFNGDGEVNGFDALAMLNALALGSS